MPWIGGSVQQWVDELTTAVLDHYAAGASAHTAARPDRAHPRRADWTRLSGSGNTQELTYRPTRCLTCNPCH